MPNPKMPRHTCPSIDDIIKYADEAKSGMEAIISEIEDLRSANSNLREGWEYWEANASELESKNERLEEELRETQSYWEDKTSELECEVETLKEQLSKYQEMHQGDSWQGGS